LSVIAETLWNLYKVKFKLIKKMIMDK